LPVGSFCCIIFLLGLSLPKSSFLVVLPRPLVWFFRIFIATALLLVCSVAHANIPGGGTGTGANVTLTDGGSTVTLANGNVSIVITKSTAQINTINYTYNGTTTPLLSGGYDGGKLYWSWNPSVEIEPSNCVYTIISNPSANGGNYAEISLKYTWPGNLTSNPAPWDLDIHYSLPRGTTGLYATAIASRPNTYPAFTNGDWRMVIYVGGAFNWFSVDAQRNFQMNDPNSTSVPGYGAPKENYLWTSGLYNGLYDCKYDYSADLGGATAWGWSSTTANLGIWMTKPSLEFYNGGPLKRENNGQSGPALLNVLSGQHYGQGTDFTWAADEAWTKTYGPFLIYFNRVPAGTPNASNALFADAQAQGLAEQSAWPYSWFVNGNYTPASGRGNVTGQIIINDSGNPNASAAGLWVGVAQTPSSTTGVTDFEEWCKNYQFWVKTDANGNFTIPHVIAGMNYNLYAFGPGAAGQLEKDNFVTVTAGASTSLGPVTWIPAGNAARVAPTVWEIGVPDRSSAEFRHGDDCWHGDAGPSPSIPSPNWGKFMDYTADFPGNVSYTVGASKWSTDWNYSQSTIYNPADGTYDGGTLWKIFFNLPQAPAGGAQASLYFSCAADFSGPIYAVVNNTNVTSPTTGFFPTNPSSDTMVRMGNQGAWGDYRLNFASTNLHQGLNEIDLVMRKGGVISYGVTWDYLRLELTGYVPPVPAGVAAYSGNNQMLLSWPVTPGATSYNLLRSTTSGGNYTLLASNVTGPVCGSGPANATYTDSTAANGATYYYVVQSVNPVGASANSTPSTGTAPSAGASTSAPTVPASLTATPGQGTITLNWTASPGANYYTIQRSTSTGAYLTPEPYITLSNTVTGAIFTDSTPTNGIPYYYVVTATNAAGTSANSTAISATAAPAAPTTAPGNLTLTGGNGTEILNWSAVPGAVGYLISRATSSNGPFTLLNTIFLTSYTDTGLSNNTQYYYTITAMNAGGVSGNATANGSTAPAAPVITGLGGTGNVTLSWSAVSGAANYTIQRSTTTGTETTIASNVTTTTYTDTGRTNGTTVFYEAEAVNSGGAVSAASTEIAVTPLAIPANLTIAGNTGNTTLSWTTVPAAANYTVRRGTVSGGPYTTINSTVTVGNLTDVTVTNGTPYFYVVAAANSTTDATSAIVTLSLSGNSTQVSATPLAPVANLTATPGNGNVSLNWTGSTGASGYTIKRSTTSGSGYANLATGVTGTTFKDSTVVNGTTYYYVVVSTNTNSGSNNSAEVNATPVAPPTAPTGLTATPGNTTVTLNWSAVSGAATYSVLRSSTSGSGYATVAIALGNNTYTDTGLTNGSTYYYVVSATNAGGASPNSAEVSAVPAQSLAQWTAAYFPGVSDPNVIGPAADPDGDGLSNLVEYLLGTNPAVPDSAGAAMSSAADGSGNLVLTFRVSKNLTGVTYSVQSSTDLVNWTDTGVTPTVQSDQGAYYIMQAVVPLGSNSKLLLRLNVTSQ
jgi:fibronectin type 3 domain-containing protein